MKNLDNTPIACSLATAELRDREAKLLAQFRSAVVEAEEIQEGYTSVDWTGNPQRAVAKSHAWHSIRRAPPP